jgi:hypothetical protein
MKNKISPQRHRGTEKNKSEKQKIVVGEFGLGLSLCLSVSVVKVS